MEDDRMSREAEGAGMWSGATGFVVGAVVGAGLALLLAPATGEETRRKLGRAADRIGDTARDGMGKAKSAIGHLKHDANDAVNAGVDVARQAKQEMDSRFR